MSFRDVVMTGLAHDRGLFIPDTLPTVTPEELESWRSLSYADMAVEVIAKFVGEDQVPRVKLEDIVKRSCAAFRSEDVTPVEFVGNHAILVCSSIVEKQYFPLPLFFFGYWNVLIQFCILVVPHFFSSSYSSSLGIIPWTNICLQGRCTPNAWKFL